MQGRAISVVIPACDEADNLESLHGELVEVGERAELQLEIIIVDDGSTDETWRRVEELARRDQRVVGVRLRRNFGKSAALAAGVAEASHPLVLTLDGDGQDSPDELPALLAKLDEGYDLVSGWKRDRADTSGRVAQSRLFNTFVRRISGVALHDFNCGLKLYRRQVLSEIALYGELHRFVAVLAHSQGFRVCELPVRHRPRLHGRSKFEGPGRAMRGLLDLMVVKFLTSYRGRPQHALGLFGLLAVVAGLLIMGYLAFTWVARIWYPDIFAPLSSRPLLFYGIAALIFGTQMLSIGFVAALITSYHARGEPTYRVRERISAGEDGALQRREE